MGVAIHHGRVYLARFIAGGGGVHSTVIGRNVNLAGRLSSAAKRPLEEDEARRRSRSRRCAITRAAVRVDARRARSSTRASPSAATPSCQLEAHLALVHGDEGVMEYEDEAIDRRILFRYAGDAKFKGVRSSLPVYEADYEGRD